MIRLKRILAFSSIICLFLSFDDEEIQLRQIETIEKNFGIFMCFIWLFILFLCFDEEEIELDFKNSAKLQRPGQHKPRARVDRSRPADRPAFCRQQAVLPGLGCAQPQPHQTDAAQFYLFFCLSFFY